MKKQIDLAIRISIYAALLLLTYYLLGIMILKGNLFRIEIFLFSLFCINSFLVGLKFFNKK